MVHWDPFFFLKGCGGENVHEKKSDNIIPNSTSYLFVKFIAENNGNLQIYLSKGPFNNYVDRMTFLTHSPLILPTVLLNGPLLFEHRFSISDIFQTGPNIDAELYLYVIYWSNVQHQRKLNYEKHVLEIL